MNEILKDIIRSVVNNDVQKAKVHIKALLAKDDTQSNRAFIQQMKSRLETASCNFLETPHDLKGILKMEDVEVSFRENKYFLSDSEKAVFDKIYSTQKVVDKISEMGLRYTNSTLLYGESGTGKTSFGRYIAYRLGCPFAYLNFSECISSYLGNTGKNISKVFDYIKNQKCVLMLDELDAIGISRSKSNEVGEMARVVIGLLQAFDTLSNDVVVLGATNREDLIDTALLRRFTSKHEIKRLDDESILQFIQHFIGGIKIEYEDDDIISYAQKCSRLQSEIINDITSKIIISIRVGEKLKLASSQERC